MESTRLLNTIKGTGMNIFEQVVTLVFGLIIPRLIIQTYGSSVNGLTSFILQVLNVFQLLQAGTIGASIYALYKPIAFDKKEEINKIVNLSNRYFYLVGSIFCLLVLCILPFVVYKGRNDFQIWEIVLTTILMGINGGLVFFFDARYDVIISSYQKRYITSFASICNKFIYYILVFVVLKLKCNFVLMYAASLIAKVCFIFILHFNYKKLSKDWYKKIKGKIDAKIPNRGYLLSNQVVFQIVPSLPYILVSSFYNLEATSIFSINYTIVNALKMVVRAFFYSVTEPLANYFVVNGKEKTSKIIHCIELLVCGLIFTFGLCFTCLSTSFINLYTRNISETNYIIPFFSISLLLDFVFYTIYLMSNLLIDILGLFKETFKIVIIDGIVSSILMFVITFNYGFEYLPLAIALFYFLNFIGFLGKVRGLYTEFVDGLFSKVLIIGIMIFLFRYIYLLLFNIVDTTLMWILHGFILFTISILIFLLISCCLWRKDIKSLMLFIKDKKTRR